MNRARREQSCQREPENFETHLLDDAFIRCIYMQIREHQLFPRVKVAQINWIGNRECNFHVPHSQPMQIYNRLAEADGNHISSQFAVATMLPNYPLPISTDRLFYARNQNNSINDRAGA